MSTGLNTNNSTIVSAFYNELLRQGLVVALIVLLVGATWCISRSAQLRRAVIEHQQGRPAGAVFAAPQAPARLHPAGAMAGTVLCLTGWVLVQDLGFMGGVGTGPNSMVPTVVLFWAGYLAFTRVPAAALAAAPTGVPDGEVAVAGLRWRERLTANPAYAFRTAACQPATGPGVPAGGRRPRGRRPERLPRSRRRQPALYQHRSPRRVRPSGGPPGHSQLAVLDRDGAAAATRLAVSGALVQYAPGGAMIDHSEFADVIDPSGRIRYDLDTDPGPATGATESSFAVTLAGTLNNVLKGK